MHLLDSCEETLEELTESERAAAGPLGMFTGTSHRDSGS